MIARGDADEIDAVVLIEALVLDGDERLPDVARAACGCETLVRLLLADLTDQRAVAREDDATTAAGMMICQGSTSWLRSMRWNGERERRARRMDELVHHS